MHPKAMKREISCQNFRGLFVYLRKHYGEEAIRKVTEDLVNNDRYWLADPKDGWRHLDLNGELLPGQPDGVSTGPEHLSKNPGNLSPAKAIISSGSSETDRVQEAQRLGARGYLKKPYTLEKVGLAFREELNRIEPFQ